jgi:hypothetical protein
LNIIDDKRGEFAMERSESQFAEAKLAQLKMDYHVDVLADWGDEKPESGGEWKTGTWTKAELDKLHNAIALVADIMGGNEKFTRNLDGVTVRKADIGSHGGEALSHRVSLSTKGTISSWTVVHELAHAWDAKHSWKLSRQLEKYTGGFTSLILSRIKKGLGLWDAGPKGKENMPGRNGRKPGCNAEGYFYGGKPGGSDWNFSRKEDFAEAVAMYVGWERGNALSEHASKRILRYAQIKNGEKDGFGVADYWEDYAKYFYPEGGDYTKTERWKFVDDLINGRMSVT